MSFHSLADDSQIYDHCLLSEVYNVVHRLEGLSGIGHWMSANRLKCNADKSELILTSSTYNLGLLVSCGPSLQLGFDEIKPSDHARLLGVTIEADLDL